MYNVIILCMYQTYFAQVWNKSLEYYVPLQKIIVVVTNSIIKATGTPTISIILLVAPTTYTQLLKSYSTEMVQSSPNAIV